MEQTIYTQTIDMDLNTRNTIIYSYDIIQRYGKVLLTRDHIEPNSPDWLNNIDRIKVTSITFNCLEQIFKFLSLNEEEKNLILDVRRKENKRVSTANRRKIIKEYTRTVEILKKVKSELEMEKAILLVDIEIYKISCN